MAGIIYTRYKGTIILNPKIKNEQIHLYTPIWVMQDVINGNRRYGHFNPKSDMITTSKNKKESDG